ncbi:DNA polymerase III subunit gamma/tau [Candidatus Gracilibacteria bacterium]|nr:DNA polymerase III subunit gamma/tau [Candidatus Gracilibacteria bacterium]
MSLYLKYRPKDFTNLVGQSFIKDTLQKAIQNNKTVGAYLFCGPRGTGKTSTARIFAKTVNCLNPINGNPCLNCEICNDFADEKLIDIIEIDAASHTGVDNIREIIEKAQFSPTKTKYKIYIIDEVHMLSKGAFNALLKILEEPPKHVKFILATTETHKVPETIISRCQRYDFKRISNDDMKNRLLFISNQENIKTDENAINYIIKNSSGGLRNAISLFEQLIENSEINYENIVKKLEIVDENEIDTFLNKLLNSDKTVIEILDKNISDGKNIKLFFKELLFYTKNKTLEELKKGSNIIKYIEILNILDDTYSKTKNSLDENITFTIGILKIINGYSNNNLENNNSKKIIYNNIIQEKLKPEKKNIPDNTIVKKGEEKELDMKDIGDIFGNNIKENNTVIEVKNDGDFDINKFITKLKENGVKSANINTIRNSKLDLINGNLNIKTTNTFFKKTLDKDEVIQLFSKSLLDLGIENIKINIS